MPNTINTDPMKGATYCPTHRTTVDCDCPARFEDKNALSKAQTKQAAKHLAKARRFDARLLKTPEGHRFNGARLFLAGQRDAYLGLRTEVLAVRDSLKKMGT